MRHEEKDALKERVESGRRETMRATIRREALSARGDTYRNFGEGFSRAFEFAVTPVLFGAMGYGLDRWIGIVPVLTIVFALVAVISMMLRTWFGYVHRMQQLEEAGPWAKRA